MKKTSLISILLVLFCLVGNAQKLQVTNNKTLMLEKSGKLINTKVKQNDYVGSIGDSHYFIINNNILLKTDKALKKNTAFELNKAFEDIMLINFSSENATGFISIANDTKGRNFILKKVFVKGDGLSEKNLQTLDCEKGDYYQSNVATSIDKTKKMVAISVISSKDVYKFTTIFVINTEGEIVWSKVISPTFKNDNFAFNDMTVSNDGFVYILAKSYKVKVKNCNLHLLKVGESGVDENFTDAFPHNTIGNANIIELSNGNFFVGGYYTTAGTFSYANDIDELGTFSYVFDNTLGKLNFKSQPMKEVKGAVSLDNSKSFKTLMGIYETTDGKVTMLAEEQIVYYSTQAPTGYFHYNVLINSFDLNGNYGNSSILFKNQVSHTIHIMTSFYVLKNNDELILIYNDNVKNDITQNLPKPKAFVAYKYKKIGQTVACTIKDGKVGKKQVLINAKENEEILYNLVEQFGNEAIIRVQTGMAGTGPIMLEKITW
ncbi:MAG: hypothetical protein LBN95_07570 [Prevotellaceae bacterium]|jgi:hypothetical protein|nr:hypothetical protein [Prevotellaceae bacterium]